MLADMWSVGCVMAELLTGQVLFPGTDCILNSASSIQSSYFIPCTCLYTFHFYYVCEMILDQNVLDRDHLNRILQICGTPDPELMAKIESAPVSNIAPLSLSLSLSLFHSLTHSLTLSTHTQTHTLYLLLLTGSTIR